MKPQTNEKGNKRKCERIRAIHENPIRNFGLVCVCVLTRHFINCRERSRREANRTRKTHFDPNNKDNNKYDASVFFCV